MKNQEYKIVPRFDIVQGKKVIKTVNSLGCAEYWVAQYTEIDKVQAEALERNEFETKALKYGKSVNIKEI